MSPPPPQSERTDASASIEDLVPPAIALAWGLRDHGTRGPKRGLTLEEITQTAIELADRDGLESVSMSRLAVELEVGTMSLYRYVVSKDELLTLMVDAGLGRPTVPPKIRQGDWRPGLEWWARGVRQAYRSHPWSLNVPITAPPLGPNNVAWMEVALDMMNDTPLKESEKVSTLLLISGFVRNDVTLSTDIAAARKVVPPSKTYGVILSQLVDQTAYPAVCRVIASGSFDDDDDDFDTDFDYGLQRILDGVDALISRRPRHQRRIERGRSDL